MTSQQIKQIMPQIKQAKQALQMIKLSRNPQAMLQQALQNNPNYALAMQLLNGANGDVDGLITKMCQEHGIDPKEFMNAINTL